MLEQPIEISLATCLPQRAAGKPAHTRDEVSDTGDTIKALVRRAQAGCSASFEQLVTLHEARIYRYLMHLTGNVHDAQDLTQVTFVKAFRGLDRFSASHSFASWLFTIAKRSALNHRRDSRPTDELTDEQPSDTQTPAVALEQRDEQENIWAVARRLPRDQFEALWLRYAEGFSLPETARAMNSNQVRVRVLLHRARRKLATLLKR